ncbi:hypothetical protein BH09PLA1_BH09PLA1_18360 [soil metagenome]
MTPEPPIIPLRICVFDAGHLNPLVQLLDVWVITAYRTKMTAIIGTEPGTLPRLHRYVEWGSLDLPRPVRDRIVLLCFDRLMRERLLAGASCDRVDVHDGARWLARQLPPADAAVVTVELTRHIDPDLAAREAAWSFPSKPN